MSPSRNRKPVGRARPRSEVLTAVAVAAGIVVGTLALIWLLRPSQTGPTGGGTGGLLSRQPRVGLLLAATAAALAGGIWWMRRGRRRPKRLSPRAGVITT